ncbi:sulfatase [Flavobacterium zhairuonense]|uniref:sulfatase family protein n=1 Tax=Flavobacterium zhairuonense TaxID=2493631 RepID=UPI0010442401|nr:sulfatase [Flavobacterium zhairuonense]KAF2507080.1 sulfatase [Flavobacterium zhairuonense]
MRKSLILILVFLSFFNCKITAQNKKQDSKPNIVIINMDDMGYGDTEPYGMTGIPTPHFNQIAQEGTRFTNFNAGQAICTASRAALLTGCYPNRIGMSGVLLPGAKHALNPKEETIASMLKKAGYKTANYGKWHLGNEMPYWPTNYGFDEFYGIPYSHDVWPIDYDGYSLVTDPKDMRSSFPPLPLINNTKVIDTIRNIKEASKLTTLFTEKAVDFIKRNKKNPFFLYLTHPLPHAPLAVSDKFKGKSELGLFGDVIMEIDWSIGEILKTLEKEGISKNTVLIITSDNGPWLVFGDNAGSSGGFREGKSTTREGGTRVPFLIRWPGKIEAGMVNSSLFTNMDLLPTIASITGASLPENKIDGLNFLPLLTGKADKGPRDTFYYYFGVGSNNLEAIRYKHWKLVFPHKGTTYNKNLPGKDGFRGKGATAEVPMALYDLAHDPGEIRDVQELYPEIVQQIQKIAETAREDLGDDLTNQTGKNIRKPAIVN